MVIETDTKAQLIEKLKEQKMNAVAANQAAYDCGHTNTQIYSRGKIVAFEKAIKITEETL